MAVKKRNHWLYAVVLFLLVLTLFSIAGSTQGEELVQEAINQDNPTPLPNDPVLPLPPDEGEIVSDIDWSIVSMTGSNHPAGTTSIVKEMNPSDAPQVAPQPRPEAPVLPEPPAPAANDSLSSDPAQPMLSSQNMYVVQSGDTLFQISLRFGVPQSVLAAYNNIGWVDLIYAGQQLIIPDGYTAASGDQLLPASTAQTAEDTPSDNLAEPADEANANQSVVTTYVVQRGDSIGGISWRFGVDMGALIATNNLTDPNYIQAGQTLIIPAAGPTDSAELTEPPGEPEQPKVEPPIEEVVHTELAGQNTYVVVHGDFLSLIADRFAVPVVDIMTANGLTNANYIYSGQTLIIPEQSLQAAAAEPAQEAPSPAEDAAAQPAPPEEPAPTRFVWPVNDYRIVNYYWAYHPGIDLVVDIGTTVFASAAGEVEFSGWNVYGYGYLVIINHGGGEKTLYAHNSELLVAEGDWVEQGQPISLSGSTGYSNWPHVHYEQIFQEYVRMNPCDYLPGGCS